MLCLCTFAVALSKPHSGILERSRYCRVKHRRRATKATVKSPISVAFGKSQWAGLWSPRVTTLLPKIKLMPTYIPRHALEDQANEGMREANEEARERHAFSKLTRVMISIQDFQQALSAATFLLEQVDESAKYPLAEIRRFRCYETAMVVAYARPFLMAKGEVGPLSWKDTGLSMTVVEKGLHEKLIKHRNTIYGHSDAEFVEMRVMVMHLVHNEVNLNLVLPRFEEGMRLSLAEVHVIEEMLRKLIQAVIHKSIKLGAVFKDRFPIYDI